VKRKFPHADGVKIKTADLQITERTVKAHLTSVYEKTKTGNYLGLALLINRGSIKFH